MTIRRLIPVMLLPLTLAACDEAAMKEFRLPWDQPEAAQEPGHVGPPEVSPVVQPIELEGSQPTAVATAEARTLNTDAFVAEGPGGAWRVEVADGKARYQRTGARDVTVDVRRIVFARGVEYVGVLGEQPFALTVIGTACTEAGMPRGWTMGARLKSGGRMVTGCAASAAEAPARATPPAAPAAATPAATAPQPAQPAG